MLIQDEKRSQILKVQSAALYVFLQMHIKTLRVRDALLQLLEVATFQIDHGSRLVPISFALLKLHLDGNLLQGSIRASIGVIHTHSVTKLLQY